MRISNFLLLLLMALFMASCSSVYKKHYDNGYTFIKHKRNATNQIVAKKPDIQQRTLNEIKLEVKKDKVTEQKKAEKTYQTYHRSLNKIENNAPGKMLTSINKFVLRKMEALKTDTIYRKTPPKGNNPNSESSKKAQNALIFAIVSIAVIWFLWILSLIPALIALSMAKKAKAIAKINGETEPEGAKAARIIALVTVCLNAISLIIIILYILLIILLLSGI